MASAFVWLSMLTLQIGMQRPSPSCVHLLEAHRLFAVHCIVQQEFYIKQLVSLMIKALTQNCSLVYLVAYLCICDTGHIQNYMSPRQTVGCLKPHQIQPILAKLLALAKNCAKAHLCGAPTCNLGLYKRNWKFLEIFKSKDSFRQESQRAYFPKMVSHR